MERFNTDRARLVAGALGYKIEQVPNHNLAIIRGAMHIIGTAAAYDRQLRQTAIENGTLAEMEDPFFANPKELPLGFTRFAGRVDRDDLLLSTSRFERMFVAPKIRIQRENTEPQVVLTYNQQHNNPFDYNIFPGYNTVVLNPDGSIMVKNVAPKRKGNEREITPAEGETLRDLLTHLNEKLTLFLKNPAQTSTRHHPVFNVGRKVRDIHEYQRRIREHSISGASS